MKRRQFVTSVLASGIAVPVLGHEQGHSHDPLGGPLANATVTFGGWQSSPAPFDRIGTPFSATNPNDITRNVHRLTPFESKIKAGGLVNFVIGGFHNVQIYEPGQTPEEFLSVGAANIPKLAIGPGIIDVAARRMFRGVNPATQPTQDRVETVMFTAPGRYLVICGVIPHFFNDRMFGWVNVVDGND